MALGQWRRASAFRATRMHCPRALATVDDQPRLLLSSEICPETSLAIFHVSMPVFM